MAILNFTPNSSLPAYDMVQARLDFIPLLNSYSEATLSPAEIVLRTNASNRTVLDGTGFTYTNSGGKLVITGGTIDAITIRIGDPSPVLQFSNLGVDAEEFGSLLSASSENAYDILFAGDDTITGADGDDVLKGFSGSDVLNGNNGNDTLLGDGGGDTLNGGDGDDELSGGNGDDELNGGRGRDTLNGDGGNDELNGGGGSDELNGGGGRDNLNGGGGNDELNGGGGSDELNGGGGRDSLNGGGGRDNLIGGRGNDELNGGGGNDELNGGGGSDILNGGSGRDILNGGAGSDVFVFDTTLISKRADTIEDFGSGDLIHLDNSVFLGLAEGALDASAFRINNSGNAENLSDRIIYESDRGNLYFDQDGSADGFSKVKFAVLDAEMIITADDFFII